MTAWCTKYLSEDFNILSNMGDRYSFGIKLEFLAAACVLLDTQTHTNEKSFKVGHRGQLVTMPQPHCTYDGVDVYCYRQIQSTIERHLGTMNPTSRVLPPGRPAIDDVKSLGNYPRWSVEREDSLMLPKDFGILGQYGGITWFASRSPRQRSGLPPTASRKFKESTTF